VNVQRTRLRRASSRWTVAAVIAALAMLAGACGGSAPTAAEGPGTAGTGPGAAAPGIDALVAAAKDEGSLVWYSVPAENIAKKVSDGFKAAYGIDVEFQRLATSDLAQRYSAEASSGTPAADAVIVSNTPFVADANKKGWTTPLADAGIPGYPGAYPSQFLLPERGTAIVSIEPSGIAYNTDAVPAAQVPTTWKDLADPRWKGKILLIDPAGSPAYLDFWSVVLKDGGPDVLKGIAANVARTYPSGVPAVEALGAGEGSVVVPSTGSIAAGAKAKGAPVGYAQPAVTNGPELTLLVSKEAAHPNAAKLFAWYILFGEGQKLLNDLPTTASPATGEDLPAGYVRAPAEAATRKDEILGLLKAP
jgi:iron(III) transport system substrate-binding protein